MTRYFAHLATITVRLPSNIDLEVQIDALRRAGIPMDAAGDVEVGYLFQRDNLRKKRFTMFRWFEGDVQSKAVEFKGGYPAVKQACNPTQISEASEQPCGPLEVGPPPVQFGLPQLPGHIE